MVCCVARIPCVERVCGVGVLCGVYGYVGVWVRLGVKPVFVDAGCDVVSSFSFSFSLPAFFSFLSFFPKRRFMFVVIFGCALDYELFQNSMATPDQSVATVWLSESLQG